MAKLRRLNSLPALPDELIEEILLRLPNDDPACLLRASLLSKSWSRTLSCPAFRRRLRALDRVPPLLGFFHDWDNERIPPFVPATASRFFLAAPDRSSWLALDCRHGRALFLSRGKGTQELLVWEPITGWRRRVPVPDACQVNYPTAAVLCAADGCDHLDCQGGPFHVIFAFDSTSDTSYVEIDTSVCVYSSETDSWGEPASIHGECVFDFSYSYSSVLVGRSLVYFISDGSLILEYDLARHRLTVYDTPPIQFGDRQRFNLMLAENGGLGAIEDFNPHIRLWSMVVLDGADAPRIPEIGYPAPWVLSRVINLEPLLPIGTLVGTDLGTMVLGFAEGTNVIFVNTAAGLFTVNLQSESVRKVCDDRADYNVIPLVSFYTPFPRGEHPSGPSDDDMEQRQPLKHGNCEFDLDSSLGKTQFCDHITPVVTPIAPLSSKIGYWWCLACQCNSRDAASYSDHINSKEHEREEYMFIYGGSAYHEKFEKRLLSLVKSGDPYRFSEQALKQQQEEEEECKGNKKEKTKQAGQDETEDMDPDVAAGTMGFRGVGTTKE